MGSVLNKNIAAISFVFDYMHLKFLLRLLQSPFSTALSSHSLLPPSTKDKLFFSISLFVNEFKIVSFTISVAS